MQKQYRLCQTRQFSYVYRRGMRASCKDLTLIYAKSRQKHVGFSVGRKVGGAVVRNLVKRRLRECIRPLLPGLKNGLYVVIAHPDVKQRSFRQLQACTDTLFGKLSLYRQADRPEHE
ncbi:MAG: ribonuclease P protein component [Clostridiales bacterium]|nr:ribonuclease P protein component [Clostridiales bacterium]